MSRKVTAIAVVGLLLSPSLALAGVTKSSSSSSRSSSSSSSASKSSGSFGSSTKSSSAPQASKPSAPKAVNPPKKVTPAPKVQTKPKPQTTKKTTAPAAVKVKSRSKPPVIKKKLKAKHNYAALLLLFNGQPDDFGDPFSDEYFGLVGSPAFPLYSGYLLDTDASNDPAPPRDADNDDIELAPLISTLAVFEDIQEQLVN